jgi:hypothetical protein
MKQQHGLLQADPKLPPLAHKVLVNLAAFETRYSRVLAGGLSQAKTDRWTESFREKDSSRRGARSTVLSERRGPSPERPAALAGRRTSVHGPLSTGMPMDAPSSDMLHRRGHPLLQPDGGASAHAAEAYFRDRFARW